MHWSEVWEDANPGAQVARLALTPLSWVYALGWEAYLGLYKIGFKRAAEPHQPVLCIGNLRVGGSGKTPVCIHMLDVLDHLGRNAVLSCSGYGSPASEAARLAPTGPLRASEWGDEPALVRWLRPDVPIVVGRRRVLAAELVHAQFPDRVMLMDDGFQHLPLRKHVTILLDPPSPNWRCLPAGPYREPKRHGRRADLVIPNGFCIHEQVQVVDQDRVEMAPGERINALCAIGAPYRFYESLRRLGWSVDDTRSLPDHDPLDGGYLFEGWPREKPIVVTAKDWVKLRDRADHGERRIWVAEHRVTIEPQIEFERWLQDRLHEIQVSA